MNEEQAPPPPADMPPAASARAAPGATDWLREGARMLAFREPRWERLDALPLTLLALFAAAYLIACLFERLLTTGSPTLQWQAFVSGWAGTVVSIWLCWVVSRAATPLAPVPGTATLLALACAAGLLLSLGHGIVAVALQASYGAMESWPPVLAWGLWVADLGWYGAALLWMLWRVAQAAPARLAAALLVPASLAINVWLVPTSFWVAEPVADADAYAGLPLTDEVVDAQPALFDAALDALQPPRPDRVNVYALTFAPFASEDVFMRESAVVARTMRERFGAQVVELVVNPATTTALPWATPANLRRAVQHIAAVMDREHDVLFLHLTSHGGADGQLATQTWPLQTEPMTPELLRRWLDEAGVRWRVVSVSACYSGSWIAPLAGDGTLVMTAADAEHTSYGCGKRSELTFFGRAMYVDALRETRSFTEAHARARRLIEVREQEAGKDDGYSNPQIREGAAIAPVLARLAEQQGAR